MSTAGYLSLTESDREAMLDAIAAGLAWTCALDTDFTGADVLRRIKEEGAERRLAAFVME